MGNRIRVINRAGLCLIFLWLAFFCFDSFLQGQETQKMEDLYPILSPTFKVPGSNEVRFQHLNFRLGWTREAPYRIAIQLSNPTYGDQKIKFAVRDLTMNQTVLLDLEHNTYFIQETLHPNQEGTLWSGTVSNLTDSFALKVWETAMEIPSSKRPSRSQAHGRKNPIPPSPIHRPPPPPLRLPRT